ncbi:Zinc transporter 3 [Hondaea fermentalgiana]|uniref:Zinc transporter 3 n=1 Tax=Hondaea fermentalgiana TaxID=2315210 RepID=A0A2R5GHP5_9STRA|nr:Zinc transporter 3 [Hondaea fermentalgiana]|eukprot:GBG30417.1 Zinc transporter 3 [Hondaea fermentalgiana]
MLDKVMSPNEHASGPYNEAEQVVGLFAVLLSSALGLGASFALNKADRIGCSLEGVVSLVVLFKGIGCGVILTTATIHLINEAGEYFEKAKWDTYEGWTYIFALTGIFLSAAADLFVRRQGVRNIVPVAKLPDLRRTGHGHSHGIESGETLRLLQSEEDEEENGRPQSSSVFSVVLLEINLLSHSVLIGVDLGLQDSTAWLALLIAICFHQFFEGFALAEVIQDAKISTSKMLTMCAAFTLTTPIGVALGIGAHSTHNEENASVALLIGIFNSFCGGILVYLGMISILLPWIVDSHGLQRAPILYPILAFLGVTIGVTALAVIGIWA